MDHSCQVRAVGWAGRVEAAGKERCCLLAVERSERHFGALEELDGFLGEAGEGDGGDVAVVFAAAQDEQDAPPQEWLVFCE
jgi:hypothetical protein